LIGAFFAGLGLNRLVPNESRLMKRTDFFGNALFIPAFLVSVGLLVDPSVMFTFSTLRIALGLALALIVGKAAAAWITGRLNGFSKAEVGLMFSLSTAQAAATLASTIIGFEIGLYGEDIVNAVMVVIVISLFVSGLGSSYFAPRITQAESDEQRLGETIVIPLAEGVDPTDAIWLAGEIAAPDGGLVVPLVVAVNDDAEGMATAQDRLQSADTSLRGVGLTGEPELRVANSISGGVDRFMVERSGSLVLLSWPGPRDLRTTLLGGAVDEIAAATDRPVAVASIKQRTPSRILLAATAADLRPGRVEDTRTALSLAAAMAETGSIEMRFGPVTASELGDADIVVPKVAEHEPGSDGAKAWISTHASDTDLVVVPSHGDPTAVLDQIGDVPYSVVSVIRRRADQWLSSDGALGVTVPRRHAPTPFDVPWSGESSPHK
jgi:hypothetical protein